MQTKKIPALNYGKLRLTAVNCGFWRGEGVGGAQKLTINPPSTHNAHPVHNVSNVHLFPPLENSQEFTVNQTGIRSDEFFGMIIDGGKINRVKGLFDCTFCRAMTPSLSKTPAFSGQIAAGMTVAQLTIQALMDPFKGMKTLGLTPSETALALC